MTDAIIAFLTAHPSFVVVLTVLAVIKTVFHPLMAVIESAVTSSGNAKAVDIMNEVEASKLFTTVVSVVDYLTSIDISTIKAGIAVKKAAAEAVAQKPAA